ncbi:flippase [Limnohabitans sp. 63ED37-2]|uniref:flippase n=1 Tax=Limnohabitans sp. 63ED37-2 TaxID=1678128 RepID=UPI001E2BD0FB|nr:flippase [Limnohabitans sp. 63ED37-2]
MPLLVAAVTVPALLDTLDKEKFGLLALAWGLIGYAGALDLGLGRALTQMVASLRGERRLVEIPDTLATASRITFVIGLIAGTLIALFALLGGASMIRTESTPEAEIQFAIFLLAIALPAQAMSATYKGLNEAFMNFKGISYLRAVLGIINFAGPYAVSFFTTQLHWLVSSLVISRIISLVIYKHLAAHCLQREPETQQPASYSPRIAKNLFTFGGWVTVSSVISPIMVQSDRFFIAAMISAAAVTTYVLPYEVVVQSLVLVGAISTVMFPGLSKLMQEKPDQWRAYFRKWLLRVAAIMMFVCVFLALFLPIIFKLWLGENMDYESLIIGRILCIGVFLNSIGSMYYSAVQAKGRADLTAKIHIFELPVYSLALIMLAVHYGLKGVACAWSGRMLVDLILLYYCNRKIDK